MFNPNMYKNTHSKTMTLYFSWNALCQNMSSPDELIDIHELPGVLFRVLNPENCTTHFSVVSITRVDNTHGYKSQAT